ncbi:MULTISPECIES: SiaB family protein kinase [Stappiaceae]|uniref:SiaB family protein kinase n=1 Tax=Stappiaceae TaxID=2821832 RepID=UPI000AEF09C9|nr:MULTISPECIES: SiaB family protein kinase [unclassified Roseibium]MBO9424736.1 SiaB family protein kinase [Labrenzia sp. R4_1]
MLANDMYSFKQELSDRKMLFAYSGYLSEHLLESLGNSVKQQMELKNAESKVAKRVFSVFVEQVQNIIRYSDEQEFLSETKADRLSGGVVAFGHEHERFFVICGNPVPGSEAEQLRTRLEEIASMDEVTLRKHYRTKLREEPEEQSEGGSIGLLEIARRATQPLEFDFHEIEGNRKFFVLKAFI